MEKWFGIGLLIFFGIVAVVAAPLMLKHSNAVASFFRGQGTAMFGEKTANAVYTPFAVKTGAIGFMVVGAIFMTVGIVSLVAALSH